MSGNIDFQGTSGIIYLSDVPLIDLATDDSGKYVALRYDGTKVVETTSSGLYLNEFGATIRGLYGVDIGGYNNQVGLSAEYDDGTQNVFGTLQYSGATKIAASNTGVHVSGNITLGGTVDGRDVAADGEKLDGIEAAATRDQTASEILTAIKTVDGSGSGLDADLLDDQQGSYYLDYNNFTNTPAAYTNSSVDTHLNLSAAGQNYVLSWSGADYEWTQSITPSSTFTKTVGNVYFNDNVKLYFGTNGDLGIYHDGQNSYINDSGTGGLNLRTSAFTVSAPTGGPVIALDQYGAGSWYYEGSSRVTVNNLGVNIDGNRLYVTNDIEAGGSLRLDGTEAWSYDGSDGTIASPKTVKAPSFVGDGSNLTGISAGATGGGSDEVFWENDTRVSSNYTITNNKNAMSAGPITILAQVTVTVGDGETWTVV
jgi:hypothetical protein